MSSFSQIPYIINLLLFSSETKEIHHNYTEVNASAKMKEQMHILEPW
jgi:hypothetical protein